MMNLPAQRFISVWWVRIVLFAILGIVLSVIFGFMTFVFPELAFFIGLLLASILIESARPGGRWYTFGIMFSRWTTRETALGLALVIASFVIIALPLIFIKPELSLAGPKDSYYILLISSLIFIFAATEELIFRGIVFQAVLDRFGAFITVTIFSLMFASAHVFNDYVSALSLVNIFLAGLLLSVMYVKTRSLWLPVSFHFFWNWGQAVFLGSPVSGYDFGISLVNINIKTLPGILYGGAFGIEGGLLATIALTVSLLITLKYSTVSPFLASKIFEINYGRFSFNNKTVDKPENT